MSKDPADIQHEERIVWTEDIDGFDYVRESLTTEAGTRARPVPWHGAGRRVGYSTLKRDAPSSDSPGRFTRRIFWVKEHDRSERPDGVYKTATPSEGVDPRTVAPGVWGELTERAWGSPLPSAAARAGRFHQGRLSDGRPQVLDAWRVTTGDANVAARVAELLGGRTRPNEGGGILAHEVLTTSESVRVLVEGPESVAAHMRHWGSKGIAHECDGSEFLSPEEKKGQPCGCPPLLEDKKLAAKEGRGPSPSIDLTFRIAAEPVLGEFHFTTASWQFAAQLSDLMVALERVGGPAVCDLTTELVIFTTKTGMDVGYRKPVVTVLGSPDTVAQEPPPKPAPTPAPAPSALSSLLPKSRRAAEHTTLPVPELTCSVNVDAALLGRAAQILGTSDHQETVIAALSEVVAGRQQAADLIQLREHVERIATIARQALRGGNSSLT
ncbi:DUF6009 family protein [Streptomyces coeruleorubidus]|uniref:DUF6009 family protein n=1 Tax=Streptomyces coeruleorubidus TaxID=116188 RepID=UPI003701BEFC